MGGPNPIEEYGFLVDTGFRKACGNPVTPACLKTEEFNVWLAKDELPTVKALVATALKS
jgi:hypothetical protein